MGLHGLRQLRRAPALIVATCCAAFLAACTSQPTKNTAQTKTRTTEYFAESEWGVKASPRVSTQASGLPRGGGRDQIGRPYQIRGQWFHPKEEPGYRNAGLASWYGDAFHGRLTANGEVYDMTHLTAAHPTMPLPSYARVTNVSNGSSVVVRVNDRGPFVRGRIIDLSRQAADLLGTRSRGLARVEVEYLGRAPLHGQDDQFLMASYRPGGAAPGPSDGLPSGVMMAMNGSSPTAPPGLLPRVSVGSTASNTRSVPTTTDGHPVLPDFGPIVPNRPSVTAGGGIGIEALSYADARVVGATAALETLASARQNQDALVAAWQRQNEEAARSISGAHIAAGTFADRSAAEAIATSLSNVGQVEIVAVNGGMAAVTVRPDGRATIDDMLRAAWAAGATDAMTVRD